MTTTPEQRLNVLVNQMLNTYLEPSHEEAHALRDLVTLPMVRHLTNNELTVQERYRAIRKCYLQDMGYLISRPEFWTYPDKKVPVILFVREVRAHTEPFEYVKPKDPLAV